MAFKTTAISIMLLAFFLTCPAMAQESDSPPVMDTANLEKVKRAKFRETYVNTGVDFSKYNKLYLGDAYFDYRDVGPAERYRSSSMRYASKTVFGISEEDRQKFEDIVSEAFMKELQKGKNYTIVDTIDDNTMIMRGAVVDIISKVPPEFVGRSEVYLATVGEATLVMEFLNGRTGEVLAQIAERGRIGSPSGQIDMFTMPSSRVSVMADVRRWAGSAARRLRSELDSAMEE